MVTNLRKNEKQKIKESVGKQEKKDKKNRMKKRKKKGASEHNGCALPSGNIHRPTTRGIGFGSPCVLMFAVLKKKKSCTF